jgi:hypothetical protein
MARYAKNPTVVDAEQAHTTDDFGVLGLLNATDWIMTMIDGTFHTMDDADFSLFYSKTNQNAVLIGTVDWA